MYEVLFCDLVSNIILRQPRISFSSTRVCFGKVQGSLHFGGAITLPRNYRTEDEIPHSDDALGMESVILNIHWHDPELYCILISPHKWSELDFLHELLGVCFTEYSTLKVAQVSSKILENNSCNIERLRR
jgi:hypothetical protein